MILNYTTGKDICQLFSRIPAKISHPLVFPGFGAIMGLIEKLNYRLWLLWRGSALASLLEGSEAN